MTIHSRADFERVLSASLFNATYNPFAPLKSCLKQVQWYNGNNNESLILTIYDLCSIPYLIMTSLVWLFLLHQNHRMVIISTKLLSALSCYHPILKKRCWFKTGHVHFSYRSYRGSGLRQVMYILVIEVTEVLV